MSVQSEVRILDAYQLHYQVPSIISNPFVPRCSFAKDTPFDLLRVGGGGGVMLLSELCFSNG